MTQLKKPVWAAPERNKEPILDVLRRHLDGCQFALEVGSGTGQHITHFATHTPDVLWQPSDQAEYVDGISLWVAEAKLDNLLMPVPFDVNVGVPNFSHESNPDGKFNLLYSANTLHIMSWETVKHLFACIPALLLPKATVVLYGPFNVGGKFTSQSNADFDASLKAGDADMGIRNKEAVIELAARYNLQLIEDVAMPANNCCLIFKLR